MRLYIEVSDGSGTLIGQPIITATSWENTPRLSRAGTFRFSMPASDPRSAYLEPETRVTCYARVNGPWAAIGAGIVKRKAFSRATGRPPTWDVSGDDLLGELNYRHVQGLSIYEEIVHTPSSVQLDNVGVWTNMPLTIDSNPATGNTVTINAANSFLFIGFDRSFNAITYDLGGTVNNNAAAANYGFADDSDDNWPEQDATDTTINTGAPFAQDGRVDFIRPSGWAERLVNGVGPYYWVRVDPDAALDPVEFREITVITHGPTTDDLANIMAYAPSGWSLAGSPYYASTASGTLQTFNDETVLAALVKTAERTGEAFRLGTGRQVEWLRTDRPSSTLRAIWTGDGEALHTNPLAVLITDLQELEDSSQLATRVYPFGAGNADARVTIEDMTLAVPAGYTVGQSAEGRWYIESDAAVIAYGLVEAVKEWKEIAPADGSAVHDAAASDELFTAAFEWLKRHEAPFKSWSATVTKVDRLIKPGETIELFYREVVDGFVVRDIRETVLVLEPTNRISPQGLRTVALKVATSDRWPETDQDTVTRHLEAGKAYRSIPQGMLSRQIR